MFKPRFVTLSGLILLAALSRLVPHPWNFTPIAGIALFGGAQFSKKYQAFLVPFAALLLTDLVIGLYPNLPFTYASFALIVLIGYWLRNRKSVIAIMSCAFSSSLLFFFLTNFGHWVLMSDYPKTFEGLVLCYTAAIPFFRNTLAGDLVTTILLFGSFSLATRQFPRLKEQTQPATA